MNELILGYKNVKAKAFVLIKLLNSMALLASHVNDAIGLQVV